MENTMETRTAMRRLMVQSKAYGHARKGKGKRGASKARRRVGHALCRNF
jgi:hypothetical protein